MIYSDRRDHLKGYNAPLAYMPYSLMIYPRLLLVWLYIQSPEESAILKIRGENRQKSMGSQRTSKEALKVWRITQF